MLCLSTKLDKKTTQIFPKLTKKRRKFSQWVGPGPFPNGQRENPALIGLMPLKYRNTALRETRRPDDQVIFLLTNLFPVVLCVMTHACVL